MTIRIEMFGSSRTQKMKNLLQKSSATKIRTTREASVTKNKKPIWKSEEDWQRPSLQEAEKFREHTKEKLLLHPVQESFLASSLPKPSRMLAS